MKKALVLAVTYALADAAVLEEKDGQKICRGLVLVGGKLPTNGAWETGVMWGLLHFGNEKDFVWDVVTGVSAGAINAAYMATWLPEDTKEMTEQLKLAWESLTTH